jgi:hypothetical protein
MVVGALGHWHAGTLQTPLIGYPGFSGNLLHWNNL